MPVIPPTSVAWRRRGETYSRNIVSSLRSVRSKRLFGGHCSAPPLPSLLASRACICRTFSGRTRSKLQRSQQRPSFIGCAPLPKPTIAPPQIEQTCTGVILRPPLCAPEQAQQRAGKPGLSNTRPAPRLPPQARASASRSWPTSDELANLVLVALLHPQQPLASFAVGAMLGGVKRGKDRS